MVLIIETFKKWLPFAALIFMVALLVYGTVQQNFRQGANDPQIQLAEDISRALFEGAVPGSMMPAQNIDIGKSLAPFVIVYDKDLKPLAYSGTLDGNVPTPPEGVFENAKRWGENRRTWEPEHDIRIAAVIRPYQNQNSSGYVLAGRSLREVETRENKLSIQVLIFMIVALAVTLAISFATIIKWI